MMDIQKVIETLKLKKWDIEMCIGLTKQGNQFIPRQSSPLLEAISVAIDTLKSKAEGRLVELPCKVGDTVYAITRCEDVMMYQDNDYLNGTGSVECPFENTCDFEDCNDDNLRIFETTCKGFWLEENIQGVFLEGLNMECYISDFGKTVFLTRKEADRALREQAID